VHHERDWRRLSAAEMWDGFPVPTSHTLSVKSLEDEMARVESRERVTLQTGNVWLTNARTHAGTRSNHIEMILSCDPPRAC
jgi:hypothetical protein